MYCSDDSECDLTDSPAARLRSEVEEIFNEFSVDLVLTGHVHSYERLFPTYNGTAVSKSYVSPTAPVYILQGASGNREGNKGSYPAELPDFSAAHATDVGYGLMTVSSSKIDWKFYSSATEQELDCFTISK
jgi:3',5'-cyclic AMP phosphodiesterase CpdA